MFILYDTHNEVTLYLRFFLCLSIAGSKAVLFKLLFFPVNTSLEMFNT